MATARSRSSIDARSRCAMDASTYRSAVLYVSPLLRYSTSISVDRSELADIGTNATDRRLRSPSEGGTSLPLGSIAVATGWRRTIASAAAGPNRQPSATVGSSSASPVAAVTRRSSPMTLAMHTTSALNVSDSTASACESNSSGVDGTLSTVSSLIRRPVSRYASRAASDAASSCAVNRAISSDSGTVTAVSQRQRGDRGVVIARHTGRASELAVRIRPEHRHRSGRVLQDLRFLGAALLKHVKSRDAAEHQENGRISTGNRPFGHVMTDRQQIVLVGLDDLDRRVDGQRREGVDHPVVADEHATDQVATVRLDQSEGVLRVVPARPYVIQLVDVALADVLLEYVTRRSAGDLIDHLSVRLRDEQRQPDAVPAVPDPHGYRLVCADPHGCRGVAEHA